MRNWMVRFDDIDTVDRLKTLGILGYVPVLYKKSKFVFIETSMNKEEILSIEGITNAEESGTFYLN